MIRLYLKYVPIVLIIAFFISQLGFVSADPDHSISWSTGPATDEGLNTIQIRNLVNQGYISIWECDNLIKSPMFGALLIVPYFIFGTSLETGRLLVLITSLLIAFLILKQRELKLLSLPLVGILFFNYYIFHFFHFSMVEILSSFFIFFGIYLYASYHNEGKFKFLLFSALCFTASYYLKIQFLYAPFIYIAFVLIDLLFSKISWTIALKSIAIVIGFAIFYFLIWFLPNQDVFEYMIGGQSAKIDLTIIFKTIPNNFNYYFLNSKLKIFMYIAYLSLFIGSALLIKSKNKWFIYLFLGCILWMIAESHKLAFSYSPVRYFISSIFSILLMISIVSWKLVLYNRDKIGLRIVGISIIASLFFLNLKEYVHSYNSRAFVLKETNTSLAQSSGKNDLMIGSWACSFNYHSRSRAFPVFLDFLNDLDPLQKFQPDMLIISKGEEISYQQAGIPVEEYLFKKDSIFISGNREIYFYDWNKN